MNTWHMVGESPEGYATGEPVEYLYGHGDYLQGHVVAWNDAGRMKIRDDDTGDTMIGWTDQVQEI